MKCVSKVVEHMKRIYQVLNAKAHCDTSKKKKKRDNVKRNSNG